MPKKRITYVPTVRTTGDLPAASSFEDGTVFYVQAERKFYYSDETSWLEVP